MQFEVQEKYQGSWQALQVTSCVALNKSSSAAETFVLTHADQGYPYRIRADYVRDPRDQTNTSAHSAWQRFMVEP